MEERGSACDYSAEQFPPVESVHCQRLFLAPVLGVKECIGYGRMLV